MVFEAQKSWRTVYVRICVLVAFGVIFGSAFLFRAYNPDPETVCSDCVTEFYASGEIPAKTVALTFDDGPTRTATPRILEVLEQENVPATFFLLGQLIVRDQGLVRDIAAAGHTIGNHGFTHGSDVHASKQALAAELNRTNKLIEALTGRTATLYRPPYLLDMEDWQVVTTKDEKPVWAWAQSSGYVPVGADLDSLDWQVTTPEEVVNNVRELLDIKESWEDSRSHHVFLFHDESHTAEALPAVIALLRERGYEIVPLHTLLGISELQAMPLAEAHQDGLYGAMLGIIDGLNTFLLWSVVMITVLTLVRFVLFVGFGGAITHRARTRTNGQTRSHVVSVLVPAYNEAENIQATMLSILGNTRMPQEVLVINDGSTDDTEARANEIQARYPDRVRVMTIPNGGKAKAQNIGIRETRGDVIIAIDGDTILHRECIEHIVQAFDDETVGAVAGKIVPANTKTLLERYQALEYLVGQNLEKSLLGYLGAVTVVPGAIGAWKRDALHNTDGYSTETLVEDQDLTLNILAQNLKVVYEPRAIAYTEVPRSMRSFYLQRFRWTYGTFQCLWKYRNHLLSDRHYRLGLIALPYSFMFSGVLPLMSLVLLLVMVLGVLMQLFTPALIALVLYTVIDFTYAWVGLRTEDTKHRWLLALIPLQRVFYLVIYALIIPMAFLKALDGSSTRWNKLKRSGSAQSLYFELMAPQPVTLEEWKPTPQTVQS